MRAAEHKGRVAVTGLGVVTSLGIGVAPFWKSLVAGRCAVGPISTFDATHLRSSRAAEIKDFDPAVHLPPAARQEKGRAKQYAIAASHMALEDAGIDTSALSDAGRARIGVSLGVTMGEPRVEEEISEIWCAKGVSEVPPDWFRRYPSGTVAKATAAVFGVRGPAVVFATACAAGNYAIGHAVDLIRSGACDVVLAGGCDPLSRVAFIGFSRLFSMASERCQPFDKARSGIILGEGAGMLVLERMDRARARGASIHAEVLGYGLSCDAHHMTAPHPEGRGGIEALRRALAQARISPDQVDCVAAHGTGTRMNDKVETRIVKAVFGDRARTIPVSAIKSMLGHAMGAASAIQAVAGVLTIREGIIPPTVNYRTPDPECDLDCVPNEARTAKVDHLVSNAFAFGGNNAALVLGRAG